MRSDRLGFAVHPLRSFAASKGRRSCGIWGRAFALAFLGCANAPTQGEHAQGAVVFGEGVEIGADTVAQVARAQQISPREAAEALREDALLAAAAKSEGAFHRFEARRALARLFARHEADTAEGAPIAPADIEAFRRTRGLRLNRPAGRRCIHAVIQYEKGQSGPPTPQMEESASLLYSAVEAALLHTPPGANPSDTFKKAAIGAPLSTAPTVEPLPAVDANGHGAEEGAGELDGTFATGLWKIPLNTGKPPLGKFSSPFGIHVVLVLEAIDGYRPSDEEVLAAYREEILQVRAKKRIEDELAALRAHTSIERNPAADELLGRTLRAVIGE